ncbi:MAG: VPGUxxT family thioredoxin-like (seleno)protein, type 2 [Planctomycetota bacterium]
MLRTSTLAILALAPLSLLMARGPSPIGGPEGGAPAPTGGVLKGGVEYGAVGWGRALEPALAASAGSGKPVLLLFQEVPGCLTCRSFGSGPLSHPLLVEAAEELFEPVVIRNNVGGYEGAVRKRFDEPAWNNPVVRFLDSEGDDLIPRRAGVWQTGPLVERMVASLEAAQRPVPDWFRSFANEVANGPTETAYFAMSCYWVGEGRLGALPGVVDTRAAWIGRREVVEVTFRPAQLPFAQLLEAATKASCGQRVFATTDQQLAHARQQLGERAAVYTGNARSASASDQLFYLHRSPLRFLPLTPTQARRVNADLSPRSLLDARRHLSPRQRVLLVEIEAALAREASALAGLRRPEAHAELGLHLRALRTRLEDTASTAEQG